MLLHARRLTGCRAIHALSPYLQPHIIDTTKAHAELDALVKRILNIEARIDALDARLRPQSLNVGGGLSDPDSIGEAIESALEKARE